MERATQPSVVREGITAGMLGATAVAIWFLIVDMVSGRGADKRGGSNE